MKGLKITLCFMMIFTMCAVVSADLVPLKRPGSKMFRSGYLTETSKTIIGGPSCSFRASVKSPAQAQLSEQYTVKYNYDANVLKTFGFYETISGQVMFFEYRLNLNTGLLTLNEHGSKRIYKPGDPRYVMFLKEMRSRVKDGIDLILNGGGVITEGNIVDFGYAKRLINNHIASVQ